MSESKHTPGPWHVIGKHVACRHEKHAIEIAEVSLHLGEEQYRANALLIAAAPDLLKACEKILYCTEEIKVVGKINDSEDVYKLLNNAVQKAKGEL